MKIAMFTNTFTPHVGGVAESVRRFTEEYRKRGNHVLVVAPQFENMPEDEIDVVRVPAIQNFNGSDFAVAIPFHGKINKSIERFDPDIIHSHHPFLLGDSALRASIVRNIPLVYTYHTNYEQYTHYVPGDSIQLKRFVIELASAYANLCSQVIAPSNSIAEMLRSRGVTVPIQSIPTGVYTERFAEGDGERFRKQFNIPIQDFVVGHLGRLAPEKNLEFLTQSVVTFMKNHPNTHFLVAGEGPSKSMIQQKFQESGLRERLHLVGILKGQELVDAYHAMDVFTFSSKSETQGMVLSEAMSAGTPVVGLDAPGVREVVKDRVNGVLVLEEKESVFCESLDWIFDKMQHSQLELRDAAKKNAEHFSMATCTEQLLSVYETLIKTQATREEIDDNMWQKAMRQIQTEWELIKNVAGGLSDKKQERSVDSPETK